MKGKTTINVNGQNVTLSFNLGAFEDFQEYLEQSGYTAHWSTAFDNMKHLRHFLSFASAEGGTPVDAKVFRSLTIDEIEDIAKIVQASIGSGKGKGKP